MIDYFTAYSSSDLTKLIPCFFFLSGGIFKSEFLIQTLVYRQIVNKNVISMHQNLSLGVDKQRQIRFLELKL